MKKLAAAFVFFISSSVSAQTLFYYGHDSVSSADFLAAYLKNNTTQRSAKGMSDYLELYINSKLKVAEARELGYDTLPQLVSDLSDLRQQILPTYLNDKAAVDRLVKEAFIRSAKDIHLAHIFINLQPDSLAAQKKLSALQQLLSTGADFMDAARRFSDDPSAKSNGGELGWITAFSLPYDFENLAYATKPGGVSTVFRSKAGYHIFKNLGERNDPGRIRASQILLAFPPDIDAAGKKKIAQLADSLYLRLTKGDNFGKLAAQFSNDAISAAADGQMQEFGIGQYDPAFEQQVFALPKDGAYSKPFLSAYGYHIVKRNTLVPRTTLQKDPLQTEKLRDVVQQSDRINAVKAEVAKKIMATVDIRDGNFTKQELWAFSDSVFDNKVSSTPLHLTATTPVLLLQDRKYTATDWIAYGQVYRYRQDGSGIKSYTDLWNEFVQSKALEYYEDHLEDFNEPFRQQVNEFRDGNLFFEIMQRKVWGPAQSDSVALAAYFNANREKYTWKESADAVVFYATDATAANRFRTQLVKNPKDWRALSGKFGESIAADSSRFEVGQIWNKGPLNAGRVTPVKTNTIDHTYSFAYVIKLHNKAGLRTLSEARGLVINDYQAELEKKWVQELRMRYPVKINQAVWNGLKKNY